MISHPFGTRFSASRRPPPVPMAPPPVHLLIVLTLSRLLLPVASFTIGVNYGTLADNLPPPAQVAAFLKERTFIDSVRLFDTNPDLIRAFAGTGISVVITVPNGDIPSIANLPGASAWVAAHVAPFYPATSITLIFVGNEILQAGDRSLVTNLVQAMVSLSDALVHAGFHRIRVSTPHTLGILSASDPPSSARFREGYDREVLAPMLEFHRKTKSPFFVNVYPYFGFNPKTLNYALFKPNSGMFDHVAKINYTNMFDAQLDAVRTAMKKLGYGDVKIAVAETGWPTAAEPGQAGATVEDAATFNWNLVQKVKSGKGTPLMPRAAFETYLFSLFNENRKPGPIAERNWGLFGPDLTPVYDAGLMKSPSGGGGRSPPVRSGRKWWCVPKSDASEAALQANIVYVCGSGRDRGLQSDP